MRKEHVYRIEGLGFDTPDGARVLEGVDLEIEAGAFVVLRGPSGSGKSSLLRLLCRLEEPSRGRILFNGVPLADIPPPSYRRQAVLLAQMPALAAGSVRDNLLLPLRLKANAALPRPDDARLRAMLDAMLLGGVGLDTRARELSVGQQQRLCLARALTLAPKVLLLDEPTASLDPESARVVMEALARQHARGATVILATHTGHAAPVGQVLALKVENHTVRPA